MPWHNLRHYAATIMRTSDVALTASFDMLCNRCPIRHLGFDKEPAAV